MKEVYLDNSATTMAYRSVGELVQKVMCEDYGNPSSMHNKGVEAEKYIKEAKETFARLWKVQEKEVYFTSGGTESDNMALIGAARANKRAGNHLITSSIEHPAIINTMRFLEMIKLEIIHFFFLNLKDYYNSLAIFSISLIASESWELSPLPVAPRAITVPTTSIPM